MIDSETITEMIDNVSDRYGKNIDWIGEFMSKYKLIIIVSIIIVTFVINYNLVNIDESMIKIFDSLIFKIVIFGVITFVFTENITIAIVLALSILVTYQIIANRKIMIELEKEDYVPIKGFFNTESSTYPEFVTPDKIYHEMILDGILDKQTGKKNEGNVLILSGINMSKKSDQGELDFLDQLQIENNISFSNVKKIIYLYNKYNKYPDVVVGFNKIEMVNNRFGKENLTINEYDDLVYDLQQAQLDFLETIIKYNIKDMQPKKIEKSNEIIKDLKSPEKKKDNKHWIEKLGLLGDLLL